MQTLERRIVKQKKDQRPVFLLVLTLAVLLTLNLAAVNSRLALFWIFGLAFGFVLQKSRFCFAAALRDPFITGSTSLLRAVILALILMTITFPLIQYYGLIIGNGELLGFVRPVGIHTAAGGFLFGFGMVIAGGCATGTLMRVGEGFSMQMIALGGFLIGTLWGAWDYPRWETVFIKNSPTIHLPDILGWSGAVLLQIVTLGAIFYLAKKYDERNNIML
ncbi:MAG: YeeE/YedE thiosulfate transporter family protein [Bacillota bacterium]